MAVCSPGALWVLSSPGSLSISSGGLLVRVALQLVELDAVQLLEALPTVFTGEVVVSLRGVLLHVPVQRRPLSTLVTTDLTPGTTDGERRIERERGRK